MSGEKFDFNAMRLPPMKLNLAPAETVLDLGGPRPTKKKGKTPGRKPKQPYLRGPVPDEWIELATGLQREFTVRVGMTLWRLAGMRRSRKIRISYEDLAAEARVSRPTAVRAVGRLERAGLLGVGRGRGKKQIFTLPDPYEGPHV